VMAHELTHALQDEHFSIEKWSDAAKPNDDAEFARHAVLEGSAFAAMMDWEFRDRGLSVRDIPDLAGILNPDAMSGGKDSPKFDSAPQFVRDVLLFPYLSGAIFSQKLLQEYGGWPGFNRVFAHPPASTQQILHPDLYLRGVIPVTVELPALPPDTAPKWRKLEETVGGEFLLLEWLKEFSSAARAKSLASTWAGDRYAVYAEAKSAPGRKLPGSLLLWRISTQAESDAALLFGGMSQALDLRYSPHVSYFRRPNYVEMQTPQGGVFLRCLARECLLVEGVDRAVYDQLTTAMHWPVAPVRTEPAKTGDEVIARRVRITPPIEIAAPPM
jgi:hypothetical protein